MTHFPPKTNHFFMKTIFIGSYKTIEECYTVIFQELCDLKNIRYLTRICFKIYIYTLYTLIDQFNKFHKDQTSTLRVSTV